MCAPTIPRACLVLHGTVPCAHVAVSSILWPTHRLELRAAHQDVSVAERAEALREPVYRQLLELLMQQAMYPAEVHIEDSTWGESPTHMLEDSEEWQQFRSTHGGIKYVVYASVVGRSAVHLLVCFRLLLCCVPSSSVSVWLSPSSALC